MVDKTSFTADEWTVLLESVMAAGIAVTMADPSGLWGIIREGFASAKTVAEVKLDPSADALVKAVVSDFATAAGRAGASDALKTKFSGKAPAEIKTQCIGILGQVSTLLEAKAPGDAAAFKGWLHTISQHVADAAGEGGFLGIGGVQVSEAEKATLAEISNALKLSPGSTV